MSELVKTEDDLDCRAIKKEFLDKLKGDYSPFVDLVKNHSELALCFRGNNKKGNKPYEKVCIYRNNHVMFSFAMDKLYFNPNFFRYCDDWKEKIDYLGSNFKFIIKNKDLLKPVKWSKNRKTGFEAYSTEFYTKELEREISQNPLDNDTLDQLYKFLTKIFDTFFDDEKQKDCFLQWSLDNNYIEYGNITKEGLKNYIKERKKKSETEKIRQQQIFSFMREQKNGYFIYDMEFSQPNENRHSQKQNTEAGISNKPDMLAIRFDSDGKPAALVFVEVKSTYKACDDTKTGVIPHIEKMDKYPEYRLPNRRREAYLIMCQYEELGLIKLDTPIVWEEYEDLPLEKILIFTDDAVDWLKENRELLKEKIERLKKNGKPLDLKEEECSIFENENGVLVRYGCS